MADIIIPVVAILMPLFLVPTIVVLKHGHRRREWEHTERMKAMELGLHVQPAKESARWGGLGAIGAGVPIASVFFAFLTTSEGPPSVEGMPIAALAWGCATLISGGAMITSLILGILFARSRDQVVSSQAANYGKPAYDPDAYDVVGSRA
jgi:hypothetical protein